MPCGQPELAVTRPHVKPDVLQRAHDILDKKLLRVDAPVGAELQALRAKCGGSHGESYDVGIEILERDVVVHRCVIACAAPACFRAR